MRDTIIGVIDSHQQNLSFALDKYKRCEIIVLKQYFHYICISFPQPIALTRFVRR